MASTSANEPLEPPRKRRRPAVSCVDCRRRKIKCDRNYPCGPCTRAKKSSCSYGAGTETITSKPDYQGLTSPGQGVNLLHGRAPDKLVNLPTPSSSPKIFVSSDTPQQHVEYSSPSRYTPTVADAEKTVEALTQRVHKLEQMLSDATKKPLTTSGDIFPTHDSFGVPSGPGLRGTLSKTRLFGPSHWMTTVAQFRAVHCLTLTCDGDEASNPTFAKNEAELNALLRKCKALARTMKAQHHNPWLLQPQLKESIPPREVADQLVELYLKNFESAYRILHIPSFRVEYAQYWAASDSAGTGFVIKLLLVMAIGACLYRETNEDSNMRTMALQWVYAAQTWLSGPFEKSRMNLTGLQVHCLLVLARQTNSVGGDLVWISVGALVRTAMLMGLHRDPRYFPKMSVLRAETRRRLWSTIIEFAVQGSLVTGMAPLISLDDFDTEPPANINDEEMDESTKSALPNPGEMLTQTSLQIMLRDSLRIRLEVARLINDFGAEPSYDAALNLSKELDRACRESNTAIQGYKAASTTSKNGRVPTLSNFHVNFFSHLLRRFLLGLHRPFAMKARSDPHYYFSRKVCLDTALAIISLEDDAGYSRMQLVGGGIFREVVTHAAITIRFELITQLEEDASNMTLAANQARREPMREALRNFVVIAENRVRLGENNVKSLVFLSMAMAQVVALESDMNPDVAIRDAARKSLQVAYDLLKERAGIILEPTDFDQPNDGDAANRPTCPPSTKGLMTGLDLHAVGLEVEGMNGPAQDLAGLDLMADDPAFDFDIPTSWLFSGWDGNSWV